MNKSRKTIFKLLKAAIVILALGNLAALFLFQYKLPAFFQTQKETKPSPETREDSTNEVRYFIHLDTDTLTYDGTAALNLMQGVSLVSSDGKTPDSTVFAHIKTGNSLSQKIIEYSADTADGRITASRILDLSHYSGPSIILPDALPQIEEDELDSMLEALSKEESIHADDGYGNDITASVVCSYKQEAAHPDRIYYTFTVTNIFNDSFSAEASLTLDRTRPVIILSETTVTVPLHSDFDALSYVEDVIGTDGLSLLHLISIDGTVDTDAEGIYVLTFTAANSKGISAVPKKLTVIVK